MSIAKLVIRQRDWSAGEIDPDGERRDDTDVFKYGERKSLNMQSLRTGAIENRYGRSYLYQDEGVRDDFRLLPDIRHSVTFAHQRATIRNEVGEVIGNLSAPWNSSILDHLVWTSNDNMIFVAGPDMRPQVIEINKNTHAWSIRDYDFLVGIDGIVRTPFYRFADYGVTMRVSGWAGNISVYFSGNVLSQNHVGAIFRYAGRQLRILSVLSETEGTAVCLEHLNQTVRYPLVHEDEMTFSIGQIAKTSISGVEGEIVGIDKINKTVTMVITNRWRAPSPDDRIVGPNSDAETEKTGTTHVTPPAATTQWDEQFISHHRGWPQSVAKDRQRIIFSNFPQLKQGIIWSAVSDPFDLQINADATGAIFELIDSDCQVFHVVGGYDEFAITDTGVFYIPISVETPLSPGSVEFRRLYAGEVANIKPVEVTEGVLFVDESLTGIYAITATGQTARPYVATEISQFHRHLFSGVKSLASNYGTPKNAARQIFVVNSDGTIVVGQYSNEREYVGWRLWGGSGHVNSVSARFGDVIFSTRYDTIGTSLYVAERVDSSRELDCSVIYGGSGTLPFPVGETVQVMADGFYLGDFVVGPANTVDVSGYSEIVVGREFDWYLMPNLTDFEGGEAFGQRQRRRKIGKVNIKVRDCQEFKVGNKVLCTWLGGEDTSQPMPKRTGVFTYREIGRSYDPEYTISKSIPGRFKMLELTTEVTI